MLDRIYDDPIIPIYKKSRTRGARAQMVPLPDEGYGLNRERSHS